MAIASMIVQPVNTLTTRVIEDLSAIEGVTIHSITEKQEIIVIVEATSLSNVNEIARQIESTNGVIGVYPAYVTVADEENED